MPRFSTVAEFLDPAKGHRPTQAERKLINDCRKSGYCELGDGTVPQGPSPERSIRADLLRLLVTGGTPKCGLHPSGLWLEGSYITGTLDLSFSKCRGQCTFKACRFERKPNLEHATLAQLNLDGSHFPGLSGHRITVDGDILIRNATSKGTVVLSGAVVRGALDCGGSILNGMGLKALNAQDLESGDTVFLRGLKAIGAVHLVGAKIGGQLDCESADLYCSEMYALNAQSIHVKKSFILRNLGSLSGAVHLASARIGDLVDDHESWPSGKDKVYLVGFTYDRISAPSTNARDRLPWLKQGSTRDGQFHPQPYTQLAKVLRQMGHNRDARLVLAEQARLLGVEARRLQRLKSDGTRRLIFENPLADARHLLAYGFDTALRWVAGYGHKPWRSAVWLAGLFLAATTLAHLTWAEGSFAPNSDVILTSPGWLQAEAADCIPTPTPGCDPNPAATWSNDPARGLDWDSFNRYGYAADLVVPVLDLGQTDAWAPSKDRGPYGKALWWGRWVLAALGWLVTALGVAAITGIMQRNAPE